MKHCSCRRPIAGRHIAIGIIIACTFLRPTVSVAVTVKDYPQLAGFIDNLVENNGFERQKIMSLLESAEIKNSIIKAITRPAERLPWHKYRTLFVSSSAGGKGAAFIRKHQDIFDQSVAQYGVPAHIIAAIIGVETRFGTSKGSYRVLDSLTTLMLKYPRRSKFFGAELAEFFVLAREENLDPLTVTGSYAGAIGYGQFMPSSYRNYAVDFDDDNKKDLIDNPGDAIASVANYLSRHHWRSGEPITHRTRLSRSAATADLFSKKKKPATTAAQLRNAGIIVQTSIAGKAGVGLLNLEGVDRRQYWLAYHNFYVIMRYNPSIHYAMAVHELGAQIKQAL